MRSLFLNLLALSFVVALQGCPTTVDPPAFVPKKDENPQPGQDAGLPKPDAGQGGSGGESGTGGGGSGGEAGNAGDAGIIPICQPKELCGDNVDNNCNGLTDEGFSEVGSPCSVGVGECKRDGQVMCTDDRLDMKCSVEAGPSQPERCDGLDNDCDGETDESDPDIGLACEADADGICATGALQCIDGSLRCVPGEPKVEVCNGLDDDCDGETDEGIQQRCYTGPEGTEDVGECRTGYQDCELGTWSECKDQTLPKLESCNGLDDNCDGKTDESAAPWGPGAGGSCVLYDAFPGRRVCSRGALTCVMLDDLCNDGIDNDGNGLTDSQDSICVGTIVKGGAESSCLPNGGLYGSCESGEECPNGCTCAHGKCRSSELDCETFTAEYIFLDEKVDSSATYEFAFPGEKHFVLEVPAAGSLKVETTPGVKVDFGDSCQTNFQGQSGSLVLNDLVAHQRLFLHLTGKSTTLTATVTFLFAH